MWPTAVNSDVSGLVTICPIDRINTLITDRRISPAFIEGLEGIGIEVIICRQLTFGDSHHFNNVRKETQSCFWAKKSG